MRYDIIVLGGGPAGLSAAVAARGRNKSVLVVGNRWQDSPLARAERVDNYLACPASPARSFWSSSAGTRRSWAPTSFWAASFR